MTGQFNLLYPEWQGYGEHQDVYHGAHYVCEHQQIPLDYAVPVVDREHLQVEEGHLQQIELPHPRDRGRGPVVPGVAIDQRGGR